jgi:hypothetical protein
MMDFREQFHELSSYFTRVTLLDQLRNYQLLKDSAPRSQKTKET